MDHRTAEAPEQRGGHRNAEYVSPRIIAMARAIYESNKFKKPWDHPDTIRTWHSVCIREARAALRAHHEFTSRLFK